MSPLVRFSLTAVIIIVSSVGALLSAKVPGISIAAYLGYICFVLTLMLLINVWKKP